MSQAKHITSLTAVSAYPVVCVTGGEPMLDVERTKRILKVLRDQNPDVVLYLYTALYKPKIQELLPLLNGVHFSLHAEANILDAVGFYRMQNVSREVRLYLYSRS